MPLFDFECRECHTKFEEIVSSETRVACPECGCDDVAKLWSPFAVGRGGGASRAARREPAIAAGGG